MKSEAERSHFLGDAFSTVAVVVAKGDVTRDDSQRRFLAQHNVQCWNNVANIRNNIATVLLNNVVANHPV